MPSLSDLSASGGTLQKNISGLTAVLASIQDMVIVSEPSGSIVIANPATELTTGSLALNFVGLKVQEALPLRSEKSDLQKFWREALAGWQAVEFPADCFLTQVNGRIVPVKVTSTPLYSEEGLYSGIVIVFRNIAEEVKLKKRQYEFLSFVSHQLRQPMGSLRWGLEVLDKEKNKMIPAHQEIIRDLLAIVLRFAGFVNQLIDVSRFEEGKFNFKKEQVDLEELVKKSFEELNLLAESQNVKTSLLTKPKNGKFLIFGDKDRLRDVLVNILSNAMRYNKPHGSVDVILQRAKAELVESVAKGCEGSGNIIEYLKQSSSKDSKGEFILFSITDNGIGIPKEEQAKIFEGFFRGSNVVNKGLQGSGLGLFIVKSIIENSKGRIFFRSEENVGTVFYLLFPFSGQ